MPIQSVHSYKEESQIKYSGTGKEDIEEEVASLQSLHPRTFSAVPVLLLWTPDISWEQKSASVLRAYFINIVIHECLIKC